LSAEIIDKVRKAVEARGINTVVIASRGGKKAIKLSEDLGKGVQVVSVTEFFYGDDVKKKMKKQKVIPVEEADLVIQDSREVKEILLNIGTGVKAAMEAAFIAKNREIVEGKFIAIAGGKSGLDTVLVLDTNQLEFESMFEPATHTVIEKFIISALL
jgi:hypothetical protein